MMDIQFNQLLSELSPYIPALESARGYAEAEYNNLPDRVKAQARPRSQSSLMNDFMVIGLRHSLLGLPKVGVLPERYGQTIIAVQLGNCTVNIKCKKINRRGQISFIPTQKAMEFMNNSEYQLSYLDPEINLIFAYQWNKIRTAIEKIYILHPDYANHFDWECEVTKPSEAIQTLPAPIEAIDDRPPKKRVKPKDAKRYSRNMERKMSDEPTTHEPRDDNSGT